MKILCNRSRSNVNFSPHFRGCANPSKLLSSSSMQSENICTLNSVLLCTTLRDKMGMFGVPSCNTILIIVYLASFPLYYCCAFVTSWPQMMCTAISVVSNSWNECRSSLFFFCLNHVHVSIQSCLLLLFYEWKDRQLKKADTKSRMPCSIFDQSHWLRSVLAVTAWLSNVVTVVT